jgi:hypothetical protein
MRHSLAYLVSLYFIVWMAASASLDIDYGAYGDFLANADALFPDETFSTSEEPIRLVAGEGTWSADAEANPDLFADASKPINNCLSDMSPLQMTTSGRLRTREGCPNDLFQANPSSHENGNRNFLERLPLFTEPGALAGYKEPDPNNCPAELNGYFVYAVCGSIQEVPGGESSGEENSHQDDSNGEGLVETLSMPAIPTGGININPCFPCTLLSELQ